MSETSVLWEESVDPAALFYNFECPAERLNLPDTLKAQQVARLSKGCVLYSDMGRILCSITEDTVGWHDPLGGCSNRALVARLYGEAPYQTFRNKFHRNGHDSFLVELEKWGLGPCDLTANVNFFSRVTVDDNGGMTFHPHNSMARSHVELRAEMNVLVILNTCQHPLDTNPKYKLKPVRLSIRKTPPAGANDICRRFRPENARGFTLTERYFL